MNIIQPNVGLRGRFRLIARDGETMQVTKDTGWFDNLILDQGLNLFADSFITQFVQVGTSNVAPAVGQTALVARVAGTSTIEEALSGNAGTPPNYYGWTRTRYRFGVGVAAGNLSEVGASVGTNSGLFSRALIVDGGGVPTTITVLPTEVLDVWYELRMYPDPTDRIFQLQVGPTLHDCVLRPARINSFQSSILTSGSFARGFNTNASMALYTGALAAITGVPTGLINSSSVTGAVQAYSSNSYRRAIKYTWGLSIAGSARCAVTGTNWPVSFQCEFTPPIPKTNLNTLELTFRMGWNRHVP